MFLNQPDADAIDALVARVEARTGAQVVTAIVAKADAYTELPWTAFALGASIAALALVVADLLNPQWASSIAALLHAVTILGAGAVCALLAVFVEPFARLFLRSDRSEVEVRQYAESLFLRRELFATSRRTAVLVLVSLFERRIEILADAGYRDRVTEEQWRVVPSRMTPLLKAGRLREALEQGLRGLEEALLGCGFSAAGAVPDELPNRPIEEEGI
jgi:putative membrane protein